jgi:hypothetical protein
MKKEAANFTQGQKKIGKKIQEKAFAIPSFLLRTWLANRVVA